MAQTPDFRFRSQFPIAGIAQLLAQKPGREQEMKLRKSQERRARFNQFLNTISTAAQVARVGQVMSAQQQEQKQQKQLQQAQMTLGEALAGQVPGALPPGTAGPVSAGTQASQDIYRSAATLAPAALLEKGLLAKPEKGFAGQVKLPEPSVKFLLKTAGFSDDEINSFKMKRGGDLKGLTKNEIDMIIKAKKGGFWDFPEDINTPSGLSPAGESFFNKWFKK